MPTILINPVRPDSDLKSHFTRPVPVLNPPAACNLTRERGEKNSAALVLPSSRTGLTFQSQIPNYNRRQVCNSGLSLNSFISGLCLRMHTVKMFASRVSEPELLSQPTALNYT